jgi:predicted AlkP superfamily phosphohydrolase/phosphomutase
MGTISDIDRAAYPPEILPLVEATFTGPQPDAVQGASSGPAEAASPEASAMDRDRSYSRAMRELRGTMDPRLVALRYDGLDIVGHYYLRYTQPRTFGDMPEEERRRFSQAIDRYYAFIDGEVAAAVDTLAPGDMIVIVSGFGMQPLSPVKHAIGRLLGDPDFSGTHERAPDGFLLAYGAAVEPGRYQRGSIVDVAPTVLYFLGLPVARDMDGYARADLFKRAFTGERPIVFIPSYSH